MNGGFIFLMTSTGVMMFIMFIMTCIAFSDRKGYAWFLSVATIILAIIFLLSGFLGFSE